MKPIFVRNVAALWLSVFALTGAAGCGNGPIDPISYALGAGDDDKTIVAKLKPVLTGIDPVDATGGDTVTLTGKNFGKKNGSIVVQGVEVAPQTWTPTKVTFTVPNELPGGPSPVILVPNGAKRSAALNLNIFAFLASASPAKSVAGEVLTLKGHNFGSSRGESLVRFGKAEAEVTAWANDSIQIKLSPAIAAVKSDFAVTVGGLLSNKVAFTLEPALTELTPATGPPGTVVTLTGTSFGATQGDSVLLVGGQPVTVTEWTSASISFVVPAGAVVAIETVSVSIGGLASNDLSFSVTQGVLPVPAITGVTPASGFAGTLVTVNGSNFGATQGASTLTVGTTGVTPQSWSATQIKFLVPTTALTAGSRPVTVKVAGQSSNPAPFSVRPSIVAVTPSGAPAGTGAPIGIEGLNFGTASVSSRVFIGGVSASIVTWTDTSLTVTLPGSLAAGTHRVLVIVGGQASNATTFKVLASGIVSIDGLTPDTDVNGTSVFVSGSGFGAPSTSSTVTIGGIAVVPASWTDGSFYITIPDAATLAPGSYDVVARVNGQDSNAAVFTVITATSPQITGVSPVSGVPGDSVRLSGINFGNTSAGSTLTIGGLAVVITSWSNSSIVAQVPSALSAGRQPIVVTVGGESSNTAFYTVTPLLSSVSPVSGPVGTPIVVSGVGFGTLQGSSNLTVAGFTATVSSWSNTSISAFVPTGIAAGAVAVQAEINGQLSNVLQFTVQTSPAPVIASVSPGIGGAGSNITVTGTNFGTVQGIGELRVGGILVTPSAWSSTSITLQLPASIAPGATTIVVKAAGQNSNARAFVVLPIIDSMNPSGGAQGLQVTLSGTNFGAVTGGVQIGGATVVPTSWSNLSVTFAVPAGLAPGAQDVNVFAGGQYSNTLVFTSSVVGAPVVYSVTPSSGLEGITAALSGANFGLTQGASTLTFGGSPVTASNWTATNIQFTVPSVAPGSYSILVTTGTGTSNSVAFAVTAATSPQITSLTPTSGLRGATVTVAGQNFGSTAGTVTVGGLTATVLNWSATSIAMVIPAGIATGSQPVVITAGGVASNTAYFSVRPLTLFSLAPVSGPVGATITATGSGFGAAQPGSILSVGGSVVTVSSWNDTTIVFDIPAGTAGGVQSVVAFVGGQASNALDFLVTGISTPQISSVTPPVGTASAQITLAGLRFGAGQGTGTVTLGGVSVPVVSWSNTAIVITVPATLAAGNVSFGVTTAAGASSNAFGFTVLPTLSTRSPVAGVVATTVTLTGSNFGSSLGASTLSIGGVAVTPATWSNASITFNVPASLAAGSYDIVVVVGGQPSNSVSFQVTSGSGPFIASVSPALVTVGTTVTVSGSNFGISADTLTVAGSTVAALSWSDTSITFGAPNLPTGNYPVVISVGGTPSNSVSFAIQSGTAPVITSVGPSAGARGVVVTVNGAGFGNFQGGGGVTFDGTAASVQSWGDTAIQVVVPSTLAAGTRLVQVTASGTASNTVGYTVRPLITGLTPGSGVAGTALTLTGSAFGAVVSGSIVTIDGGNATVQSWSDTSVVVTVPGGLSVGSKAVSAVVNGQSSNAMAFTITAVTTPVVSALSPATAAVGQTVTLTGSSFGANQGTGTITLGGVTITPTSWSDTTIVFVVPAGTQAGSQNVVITVVGQTSNLGALKILPAVTGLSSAAGTGTTLVTLSGSSFGPGQGLSTVSLGGQILTPLLWANTSIQIEVPTTLGAGIHQFSLVVSGETSAGVSFAVTPFLASASPSSGSAGVSVSVSGTNFGPSAATSTVSIGGVTVTPSGWSNTAVSFVVPAGVAGGAANIVFTVGGQASNALAFTVQPAVTSISPVAGSAGAPVRLAGTNFGATQGSGTVTLDGALVSILGWSSTAVTFQVPAAATAGRLQVLLTAGQAANPVSFTVMPVIDDVVSPGGPAGTGVTLSGHHFGSSGRVTVKGRTVTAASWTDTLITLSIPGDLAAGDAGIVVTSAGQPSNSATFTVTAAGAPAQFGMTPVSATTGTVVTLTGVNFNPVTGSTITIGGVTITPDSWTDGTITFTIPPGLPTGTNDVVVTVGGVPSNNLTIDIVVPGSPYVSSTEPAVGASPSTILIEGTGFGTNQGGSTITVDGVPIPITTWDPTDIIGSIPGGLPAGEHEIVITVGGLPSNTMTFTVRPSIGTSTPSGGAAGTVVTLTGTSFGATQGVDSAIIIAGVEVTPTSWSDGSITFVVPATIAAGPETIYVVINNQPSNAVDFNVTSASAPVLTGGTGGTSGISPTAGAPGTLVALKGERFGSEQGASTLTINGLPLIIVDWSNLEVTARIPSGIDAGIFGVVMTVDAVASNSASFTVLPAISSVSPSGGPVGATVTISGDAFGTAQGGSTLTFGGIVATATSWSRTSIVVTVPAGAVTGTTFIAVIVDGQSSNAVSFEVTAAGAPTVGNVSPASGPAGTVVTITGSGFGDPQGVSTITVGGVTVVPTVWADGTITFTIPVLPSGDHDILITVGGIVSNTGTFTVGGPTDPTITGIVPSAGPAGSSLTISGSNFGALQGAGAISIGGVNAPPSSWSATSLVVAVPASLAAGIHDVQVTVGGVTSNSGSYTIRPVIDSLLPDFGPTGVTVAVFGHTFGAIQGTGEFTVAGVHADASSWSDTKVVITIPGGLSVGARAVVVTIGNQPSNSASFNVTSSTAPTIGSASSTSGVVGDSITLTGTNFGPLQSGSTITVGGIAATVTSWSNTSITYVVPAGTQAGVQPVEVTVGGQVSNTPGITILPAVTGTAPLDATGGTLVTLTGTSFGATPGTLVVGGVTIVPATWDNTTITFVLPASVAGGVQDVFVTANGETSAVATLTVHPELGSLSPSSVTSGMAVTLAGTNFGSSEGTNTVTIDGVAVAITSWSTTAITFDIPPGLAAGTHSLQATVGGETGTALTFTVEPAVTGLNVLTGTAGTVVTLTGTSFGSTQTSSTLTLGGVTLTPSAWADGSITVTIPSSVKAGIQSFVVTVNGEVSAATAFTVRPSLGIVSPSAGTTATSVTVSGTNFGPDQTGNSITVGGVSVTATAWSATSITFVVPSLSAGDQNIIVVVDGQTSGTAIYTVQPNITSVSPANGAAGASITIAGTGFGTTQNTSLISVKGVTVVPGTWSATSIVFSVPATVAAGAGNISLTIGGQTTTYAFTVDIGAIALGSASATGGDTVTITGTNFGTNLAGVSVTVGGVSATVNSVSATAIDFEMPDSVTGGTQNIIVTVNGKVSAPVSIDVTPTLITALPAIRTGGDSVTLTGTNFGASLVNGTVLIGGVNAATTFWSQTSIVATMPDTVTAGTRDAWVVIGGETSGTAPLTVTPTLGTLNPTSAVAGSTVVLSGTNFGGAKGVSTFTLAGIAVTTTAWSQTSISWTVPAGTPVGSQLLVLTVGGQSVNTNFTVVIGISLSPNSGTGGDTVTINGSGFGVDDNGGASTVTIANILITPLSWSDSAIQFLVPNTAPASAQPVTVTVGAQSNSATFTISPSIVSLSPASGTGGTSITLVGTNLGASQLTSTIFIDGFVITPTLWSATSIEFQVPNAITAGTSTVSVTVAGLTEPFSFAVKPFVGGLSVGTGAGGTVVTATGTNFGSAQGASTVLVGGVTATITNWYPSLVTFTIPNDVTAGVQNVVFNVGSQLSNTTPFTVTPAINSLSPASGGGATVVTVDGTNFGATQLASTLTVAGMPVTPTSWNDTTVVFTMPNDVTGGTQAVVITVGGQTASANFIIAPAISLLTPTSGVIATSVTVGGKNFGTVQGASNITIGGVVATATGWSPLAVTFSVPAAITGGTHNVLVTVGSVASNTSSFTVIPSINLAGLSPVNGPGGTSVTISGNNFGGTQGSSTVAVDGIPATVTSWGASSVVITMPDNVTGGTRGVVVTVSGEDSNASNFTVEPKITLLSPTSGFAGTAVTVTGTNFGNTQSGGMVTIAGIQSVVTSWSMTGIAITIPNAVTAGTQNIVVTTGGQVSNGSPFTVAPAISGLNPITGTGGTTVTVSGVNFGTSQGASTVLIGGFGATVSAWYANTVTLTVPNAVTGGTHNVVLIIGGQASNTSPFTVVPALTSLSALTGTGGDSITLSGSNFGAVQGASTVAVDGISATVTSWGASSVIITMPNSVTAGTRGVVLTAGGQASNASNITVTPKITLLAPLTGSGGTAVTVTGTNFGNTQLTGTVTVGGVSASVTSWGMGSISITIPNAVTGGTQNVIVTSNSQVSNTSPFNVTPTITGLNPIAGTSGDTVTISGTNFGTAAGTVNIGGFTVAPSGWYAGTVTFTVPSAVTAGTRTVVVSVGGQTSNGSIFTVAPSISGLSPANGVGGTTVTISGTNFGAAQGTSRVSVGGFTATATIWASGSIDITIPNAVTGGTQSLVVTVNSATVSTPFVVKPAITLLTPNNGTGGSSVTITGTGFGATKGTSTLTVAGVLVATTSWASGSVGFTMPNTITAQTASVVVTVGSQVSTASNFLLKPNLTLLNPVSGNIGIPVTLTGTNFGVSQGGSTVLFGVTPATVTGWSNTSVTATVPGSLSSGAYSVTLVVGGQTSNGQNFTASSAFLVASAETLDCEPVDGHIDHYKITYNEAVNDSTFEGYVLNSEGSVTARWEVAGHLNVRLHHGTSLAAVCGTDTANDAVQYLKFTADTAFNTGEKPDLTVTAALVTALAAPANRTLYGTGTIVSTDLVETDKAGPFVYYARGAEAGAAEMLAGSGDKLEIRFSEKTNAASLTGVDLDTVFALSANNFGGAGDIASTVWTQTDVTNDTLIVTLATNTPTVAIGDTIKAQGATIVDLAANLPAAIVNVLTPPAIVGSFNPGANGPYVTDADYFDTDADGHLDHARVTFSASVVDNTFPGYVNTSAVGNVTALWQVAGHSNVAIDPTLVADIDNDNVIWLSFGETSAYDTGVKPDLTAAADATQLRDAAACYFNANNVGTACTDSAKAVLASADVNEGDKAPPIIMHATGKAGSDKVFVLFSENVWSATGRPSCGAGGQFSVADFSYGNIIGGGATSFINMDTDVCGATDALVVLLTDNVLDITDVNFDMAKPNNGTAIYDQADNAMVSTTQQVIEGTTAPYLIGASSFKVGANFYIRVVYSEDVNATQALTAANYSVTEDPATACADIAATPTTVVQVSGNIYDIQTGTQCGATPLTYYRVTVNNVTDANEGALIGIPNIATTIGTDTADVTPPRLLEARAITPTTVQLTFSEPMKTGNVNGTAECAAAGFPITCATDYDGAGGTQLKYTLLPSLGTVSSVLKTANTSVFLLTHSGIQSGTFYTVTAADTVIANAQLLDASTPGVPIGSVPRNQATFQGMGALITQATDGPLFTDPFGDGTTNNFAFTYASRVYVGPNGPNNGEFRFEADGANPMSVQFVGPTGVACPNSVSFGVTLGTVCVTPTTAGSTLPIGPTGEQGVVGFNSGTVTVPITGGGGATTTRELLMVGPIKDGVNFMYFSEDVDTSLNFTACSAAGGAGVNSKSIQTAYSWGSNMYLGISSEHAQQSPYLNKIPLTAASATANLACSAHVYFDLRNNTGIGKSNTGGNPANGTVGVVGIDSMLYVPTGKLPGPVDRFYIANNGGVAVSTGEPTASGSFTTFMLQSYFAGVAAGTADDFTLVNDSLQKISPGRKGAPFMLVYKDVMFLVRNVAVSGTTVANMQTSNGGELWKCSASCTTNTSWSRVLTSTPVGSNAGMEITNNKAISMLQVSGGYLYVGFDNMTDGARMYRTAVVPSSSADFTEVGRIASRDKVHTNSTTTVCSHGQSLGGICMGYQILSSSVITKNQYSYIYFTVGCTLISQSGDEQICDINNNPSTGTNLPAMSVLIQRD